jgi:hypothetical protein
VFNIVQSIRGHALLKELGFSVGLRYSVILDTKEVEVLSGRKLFAEAKKAP